MGLNIGIIVKKQTEGYGCDGYNPKGTISEIEKTFFDFLNKKFPKGGFGDGWVMMNEKEFDFDVRIFNYGNEIKNNGYELDDFYLAMTEFIYKNFSHLEGIQLRTYWSG